ncbi:MAG: hypothetical protein ABFD69_14545 [Candidatus Sumerlaeia bacterium]
MLIRCLLFPLICAILAQGASFAETPAETERQPALDRGEARRLAPAQTLPSDMAIEQILPPQASRARLEELRQTLNPRAESTAPVRIRALEGFLDFDAERQVFYSPGRARIQYNRYDLVADRLIYDQRLEEFQAEGNVELKFDSTVIKADSMRYNIRDQEGLAQNVNGSYGPVHFRMAEQGKGAPAQFQKVSRNESVFRNTNVTTCDFKVPHYFVRGREVMLYQNDRIFFRGATIYVSGVPVLYLPVYTRSLIEPSPWSFQLGYGDRTGARVRVGYRYSHRTEEPSLDDEKIFETRSEGVALVYMDLLSRIGYGGGFDYNYSLADGRHRGELSVYGLSDHNREVAGADPDDDELYSEGSRWRFGLLNRSQLSQDLSLVFNIDEFSDPDIFYDALDYFTADQKMERYRQVERRGRGALTYAREAYVGRIMADVKDRIGLDRYTDYSNPKDNDRDFDLEPSKKLDDVDADGISKDRWGRVTERFETSLASRWLPIGRTPTYYNAQFNLYRALDKGLNTVSGDDDAWVGGGEFYQALMRQWKLSERYTLLTKAGIGVGGAERDNDDYGIDFDDDWTDPQKIDGVTFVDDDHFLVGERKRSFDQINPFYLWGDAEARLNARFSDSLNGWLRWRGRQTTDDFIGDWYASLGSLTYREDLYNYKIRENWLETQLNYDLARPILRLYAGGGVNMIPEEDLYSQEPTAYVRTGYGWANQLRTLTSDGSIGIRRRQVYDPTDPDEYQENRFYVNWRNTYQPIHQRWWTGVDVRYEKALNEKGDRDVDSDETFFSDVDPHEEVRWRFGSKIGPKYSTEFYVNWDKQVGGLHELNWRLNRDLHDAVGWVAVRLDTKNERGEHDADSRHDQQANNMDVRFGMDFKLAQKNVPIGPDMGRTIREPARSPELQY